MRYLLAIDQGNQQFALHPLRPARRPGGFGAARIQADLSEPGWVEQDPEEIWQSQVAVCRKPCGNSNCSGGYRRDRHYQSARNGGRLGQENGKPS